MVTVRGSTWGTDVLLLFVGTALPTLISSALVLLLTSCVSYSPPPTLKHPRLGCYVSCPYGQMVFVQQLRCGGTPMYGRSGPDATRRWFKDVTVLFEDELHRYICGFVRPDGTVSNKEIYPKEQVVLMSCEMYRKKEEILRPPELFGREPGKH